MTATIALVDPSGTIDLPRLVDYCRTAEPDEVANTREETMRRADYLRGRDKPAQVAHLMGARVTEWEMAHRWPAGNHGPRTDDRPVLGASKTADHESWSRIYAVGAQRFDWITSLTEPEQLTQAAIIKGEHTPPADNDWYTPRWLFDQLGLRFDIDVAAPADTAHRSCPADRYYTEADDGLTQPWEGLIWCNPPYSDPTPWIRRWAAHNEDALLLTHFSVASRRMPELWSAADGIRIFAAMWFDRPDGTNEKPFWGIQLAARGPLAVTALENVDNEWASPLWVPL